MSSVHALPGDHESGDIIVRLPQVQRSVGLSRATIYRLMTRGEFPQSFKLGERAIALLWSDVKSWIAARSAAGAP